MKASLFVAFFCVERRRSMKRIVAILLSVCLMFGNNSFMNNIKTSEAAESIYSLIPTSYGERDSRIKTYKLKINKSNVEIIETGLSDLLVLKENLSGDYVNIHFLSVNGIIKTFKLKEDDEWIDRLNIWESYYTPAITHIIYQSSDRYSQENISGYSDSMYKIENPYLDEKYDLLNVTTGIYYEYGFDRIDGDFCNEKVIEFVDGDCKSMGYLNSHGEKILECDNDEFNDELIGIYGDMLYYEDNGEFNAIKLSNSKTLKNFLSHESNISFDGYKVEHGVRHVFDGIYFDDKQIVWMDSGTNILKKWDVQTEKINKLFEFEDYKDGYSDKYCSFLDGKYIIGDNGRSYLVDGNGDTIDLSRKYGVEPEHANIVDCGEQLSLSIPGCEFGNSKYFMLKLYHWDWNDEYGYVYDYLAWLDENLNEIYRYDLNSEEAKEICKKGMSSKTIDNYIYYDNITGHDKVGTLINGASKEIKYYPTREIYFYKPNGIKIAYFDVSNSGDDYIMLLDDGSVIKDEGVFNPYDFSINAIKKGKDMLFDMGKDRYIDENGKEIHFYNDESEVVPEYMSKDGFLYDGNVIWDLNGNKLIEARYNDCDYFDYMSPVCMKWNIMKGIDDEGRDIYVSKSGDVSEKKYLLNSIVNNGLAYTIEDHSRITQIINDKYDVIISGVFDIRASDPFYEGKWERYVAEESSGWCWSPWGDIKDDGLIVKGNSIILRKNNEYYLYDFSALDRNNVIDNNKTYDEEETLKIVSDDVNYNPIDLKIANDIEFKVPSDIPILGGTKVNLDLGSFPVQFETEGNTYRIGFGFKEIDLKKMKKEEWTDLKKLVDKWDEDIATARNIVVASSDKYLLTGGSMKNTSVKVKLIGYAEGTFGELGDETVSGKIKIEFKAKYKREWQTFLWSVPIVLKLKVGVGVDASGSVKADLKEGYVYISDDIEIKLPEIEASAGVGVSKAADISVYGKVTNKIKISTKWNQEKGSLKQTTKASLSGELGISAKALFWSAKKTIIGKKKNGKPYEAVYLKKSDVLYYKNGGGFRTLSEEYDDSEYEEIKWNDEFQDEDYCILRDNAEWQENDTLNDSISVLEKNTYNDFEPQLIETDNGTKVIFYIDDISTRTNGNHTALVYSVLDEKNNKWSSPVILDDDGTADLYPDVSVEGKDIYVVWMNSKKTFVENEIDDENFINDFAKNCEINLARLNIDESAKEIIQLSDDNKFDSMPQISNDNGKISVAWIKNENNDALKLSGNNQVYYIDDIRENIKANKIAIYDEPIVDFDIGTINNEIQLAITICDSDYERLMVISGDGSSERIVTSGDIENISFSKLNNENVLIWYENNDDNILKYVDSTDLTINELMFEDEGITNDYSIVNCTDYDLIIFSDGNNDSQGKELYAYVMKENNASGKIQLTDLNTYCEKPIAIWNNNDGYMIFAKKTIDIGEEIFDEKTDICCKKISLKHDLIIDDVNYVFNKNEEGTYDAVISVGVTNNGLAKLDKYNIKILDRNDNIIVDEQIVNTIDVGAKDYYTYEMKNIDDLNDLNNKYTVTLNENDSKNIELSYMDFQTACEKIDDSIHINVSNNGLEEATSKLYIYNADDFNNPVQIIQLDNIKPGQDMDLVVADEVLDKINGTLCAKVVPDNGDADEYLSDNQTFVYVGDDVVKDLDHIEVTKEKTNYYVGDRIDIDDLEVEAVYKDGTRNKVDKYETNIDMLDSSKVGIQILKVYYFEYYQNREVEFEIMVSEKSSEDIDDSKEKNKNDSGVNNNTKTRTDEKKSVEHKNNRIDGVGTISSDGSFLTDIDGSKYWVEEKITTDKICVNSLVADKKSSGKYKITKIIKKGGKVTGGNVTFMKPYNMNSTTSSIKSTVKLGGVAFKITEINSNAFKGCLNITKVVIGKHISKIGRNAFYGCNKLKTIIIKTKKLKKKSIGAKAFKGINKKAKFKVPKKKLKLYKKLIKKAKAPKKCKITK